MPAGSITHARSRSAAIPPARSLRRQGETDGVAAERLALQAAAVRTGVPGVLLGDHEVEPAGRQLEQPLLGRHLGDLDPQRRLPLGEQGERVRQDRLRRGLQHRDAHGRDAGLQRLELAADLLLELERTSRVRGQRLAVRGQPHASAVGHEERHPGVLLELGELLGDRRRAVGESLGDSGERAAQGEFVQQAKAAQFEHEGIPIIDRTEW